MVSTTWLKTTNFEIMGGCLNILRRKTGSYSVNKSLNTASRGIKDHSQVLNAISAATEAKKNVAIEESSPDGRKNENSVEADGESLNPSVEDRSKVFDSQVAIEFKEPVIIEESSPGVTAVVYLHEIRCKSEHLEAKQFERWKEDKAEQEEQVKIELDRECERLQIPQQERIRQYKRMKQVEAELKVYEGYRKNACGELEITTDSPHGKKTKTVLLPKTECDIIEKVIMFSTQNV